MIVDATLLQESQRLELLQMEAAHSCERLIIDCHAPVEELRRRILARESDPSEANLEVLERQLQTRQPIGQRERELASVTEVGPNGLDATIIESIRERLFS